MAEVNLMKIIASIPSFKEFEIEAPDNIEISELKERLCRRIGIESDLTKLILNGNVLEES